MAPEALNILLFTVYKAKSSAVRAFPVYKFTSVLSIYDSVHIMRNESFGVQLITALADSCFV